MSDTPRTDAAVEAAILQDRNHPRIDWVPASFARELERERDEARNKMADALQEVDLRTLDFERMKKERDEAREEMLEAWLAMDYIEGTDRINKWRNKHANILEETI